MKKEFQIKAKEFNVNYTLDSETGLWSRVFETTALQNPERVCHARLDLCKRGGNCSSCEWNQEVLLTEEQRVREAKYFASRPDFIWAIPILY